MIAGGIPSKKTTNIKKIFPTKNCTLNYSLNWFSYILGYYWIIATLTSVGYGDYSGVLWFEQFFQLFLEVIYIFPFLKKMNSLLVCLCLRS
jgi:hypothetical protein